MSRATGERGGDLSSDFSSSGLYVQLAFLHVATPISHSTLSILL